MSSLSFSRRSRLARRFRMVRGRQEARVAAVLRRFFREQAARVVGRFGALMGRPTLKAEGDVLLPPSEDLALARTLEPLLLELFNAASVFAVEAGGAPVAELRLRMLLAEAGTRIRRINGETRRAVQAALVRGRMAGYSDWQVANGVPKDGYPGLRAVVRETYRGRAEAIARTEIGTVSQLVAVEAWESAGVGLVDVYDGRGCGWRGHEDTDTANGSRRTLAEARAQPLSHPRCRRVFLPVVDSRRR